VKESEIWPSADDLVMDAPILAAPVVITRVRERRGPQTTEFWMSVVTIAGSIAGVAAHVLPGAWAAVAAAIASAAYSVSRAAAKSGKG
jgi:hypothetical protein